MENNVTKKPLPPYLILCMISLIAALILAVTNAITAGPIAEHKMAALQETFSAVLPADAYEEVSFNSSTYANVSSIYAAKDESGKIIGYCVTASQTGYAGPVAVTFGMDTAGNVLSTKVGDTDFQETTGIGARALNPEFAEQFTGMNAAQDGAFEALSGATFTSKAVLGDTNGAFGAFADAILGTTGGTIVFGTPTGSSAAASGDSAALEPGATLTGEAQGFGGTVTVTVVLDDDTNIASLTVDAPDETEGLGKRTMETDFTDQFVGLSIPVSMEDISAVSGANITSTAVVNAINSAQPASAWVANASLIGTASGFGGDVTVTAKLDADAKIASISIDTPNETEGLGKECSKETFTQQFIGKAAPFTLGENVDAVSGATVTSTAVVTALNNAKINESGIKTIYSDDTMSIGLTEDGAVQISAAEGYTGSLLAALTIEDGVVVSASPAEEAAADEAAATEGMLSVTKPGFGDLDVVVSLTLQDDHTIGSLIVDASTQTAGLGQLCAEEAFTSQFLGKAAPFTLGENIDAVSGATLTSTAVVEAVNELLGIVPEETAEDAVEETTEEAADDAEEETEEDVLTITKPGFSDLDVVVSITKAEDGTIATLTVDASTQTPGLGQLCAEEAFTSQFIGQAGPFVLGENVDAVSGATLTSTAVVDAVNELLAGTDGLLTVTKPGFSDLDVVISITKAEDGTIATLTVDASTQTAGLGQLCADEAFTSQFVGQAGPFTLGENIDAVTGATLTSTAVVEGVNELIQ